MKLEALEKKESKRKETINLFDSPESFKLTYLFKSDALDQKFTFE